MIYHRFFVVITVWLTFVGISANYYTKSVLAGTQTNSSQILLADNNPNQSTITSLKLGDKGEKVKLLQNNLKSLGYFKGEANGNYTEDTKKAILEFQKQQGLTADGVATIMTQQVMEDILFDRYMNQGYDATENKDYTLAKTKFEQALKIKPNNFYAQKAKNNIQKFITRVEENKAKEAEQKKKQREDLIWLIAFSISGLIIILVGLLLFNKLIKKNQDDIEELDFNHKKNNYQEKQVRFEEDDLKPIKTEQSNNNNKDLLVENSLSVQQETLQQIQIIETPTSNDSQLPVQESLSIHKENSRLNRVDGVEELIKDLQISSGTTRRKAIWELAQRADSRAMEPLVELMMKADSQECSLILEAISQISTRTLKPLNRAFSISLNNENAQVRLNAIRDLTAIYQLIFEVNQYLYQAINDEDKEVRETAQWALKKFNQIQGVHNQDTLPSNDI